MRAVVFDMDGTLLDSVPTVSRAYADAIRSLGGPPVSPDEVVAGWHVGHTELVLAHFLGRTCGPAEVERFHAHLDPAVASCGRSLAYRPCSTKSPMRACGWAYSRRPPGEWL
jgi:phosphoglycolate phosphatase-like HAD superfamily hydrolase